VTRLDGKTVAINTKSDDTVLSVVKRVPGAERLVLGGKELDDEATLVCAGIQRDDTVKALGRLRGSGDGALKSKRAGAGGGAFDKEAESATDEEAEPCTADARRPDDDKPIESATMPSPQPLLAEEAQSTTDQQVEPSTSYTHHQTTTSHDNMLTETPTMPSPEPHTIPLLAVGQKAVGQLEVTGLEHNAHSSVTKVGEALSSGENASVRLAFNRFADCNRTADASLHRLSKAALAPALAALNVERADYEIEELLARFDLNSDGEIDFQEFCIIVNSNSDVEKVLKSLAIEDVIAAFMPKGSVDDPLSAFFDMKKAQVKTAVVAAVDPVIELIWAAIEKAAKAAQKQTCRGGGKFDNPLKGGKIEEFYQVRCAHFACAPPGLHVHDDLEGKWRIIGNP